MKKFLAMLLAGAMMLSLCACGSKSEETPAADTSGDTAAEETTSDYKIGIMTTTVSQSEESYRAAEMLMEQNPDKIVLATFPDKFATEQETTISTALSLASDPDVKAIIFSQAVQGTAAACQKIREVRPDILLIAAGYQDDSATTAANCDIFYHSNVPKMGFQMVDELSDMGAKTFVHYSFPRHLAWQPTADRLQNMKDRCAELGLTLVETTTPDPMSDAGTSGTQQFILEDVPQQLKKYEGKKVAFFTTNCGMQPSLQTACLDEPNAYYPQPCCPSPYHAFPATLGLELAIGGDDEDALKQIAAKLKEHDAVGRFSTWASPVAMTIIAVGVDYAKGYITGEITDRNDADKLVEMFNSKVEGAKINNYTNAEGETFDNYYTILLAPVDFNDYL